MRVIAGKFRGRPLVSFSADHIRPTTDRVKESIFNKLQGYMDGALVLDLFAGTGNLSIEAISRGAAQVEAVELSKRSIDIIKRNLEKLGIDSGIRILQEDVLKYLKNYAGPSFDVIFADPPFTQKMADAVLKALANSSVVGVETMIVIEASAHETVLDDYGSIMRTDVRHYGDKTVSYFERKSE